MGLVFFYYGVISVEQKNEKFHEKVLRGVITKEQWFDILRNGELVDLKDMKILLNIYSNNGQPLKTTEIGESLDFGDIGSRIQSMGKRIVNNLGIELECENRMNSWEYKFRYWLFMLEGKKEYDEEEEKYYFVWNLKDKLREAIKLMLYA